MSSTTPALPRARSALAAALVLVLTPAATCSRTGLDADAGPGGGGSGGGAPCPPAEGACVGVDCACRSGESCCCVLGDGGAPVCHVEGAGGQAPEAGPEVDPCFALGDGGPCHDALACGVGCGLPEGECCCLCVRPDGGCCSAPVP
jgi:hypothetical protein